MNEYEAYHKELEDTLKADDHELFMRFAKKWGFDLPDETAEMTRHKTITGLYSLPAELREKSKKWLTERGYRSLG